ncbi:hypothetical protein, partial [Streptococcus suis]
FVRYMVMNDLVDAPHNLENSAELNSKVLELFISDVQSRLTPAQFEALDFASLEDNLREIFNSAVSDYIKGYVVFRDLEVIENVTDYESQSTRTI